MRACHKYGGFKLPEGEGCSAPTQPQIDIEFGTYAAETLYTHYQDGLALYGAHIIDIPAAKTDRLPHEAYVALRSLAWSVLGYHHNKSCCDLSSETFLMTGYAPDEALDLMLDHMHPEDCRSVIVAILDHALQSTVASKCDSYKALLGSYPKLVSMMLEYAIWVDNNNDCNWIDRSDSKDGKGDSLDWCPGAMVNRLLRLSFAIHQQETVRDVMDA